jgi:hypothetical protein
MDLKVDITWGTKYVFPRNGSSMKKSEANVDMSRLPPMHCCSPVIKVCHYLFTELNDELTKRTVLSIVISWMKSIVHVTHSLFLSSISAIFLVSACQKFRRKQQKKKKKQGCSNYSVYFIGLITFPTDCHDSENCIFFPVWWCVFSLPPKRRRDCSVFLQSRTAKENFSLEMTENRGQFLQCNCGLWKTFRGIVERIWNVFRM